MMSLGSNDGNILRGSGWMLGTVGLGMELAGLMKWDMVMWEIVG